MKQCPHCSAPLDDDALFCTSCGTQLSAPTSGRTCPACGAQLDADSVFCTTCGNRVDSGPQPAFIPATATATTETAAFTQEPPVQETVPASNTTLIAIIAALVILIGSIGGYLYYDNVYLPEKTDREAPRYYTLADAVVLRSSKSAGADYNKIGSLPYGTELIMYEQDSEWSRVKVNTPNAEGKKATGYVASPFLLSKPDFFLLNSVFGDHESKENISTTKCRLAVLNYYKSNGYIGKLDDQLRTEAGITTTPDSQNQWQIFCRPKDVRPNNVLYKRAVNGNSKFTDFAVIISNINNGERKVLYFYFDDDETPHLYSEQTAPADGYLRDAVILRDGSLYVNYSY